MGETVITIRLLRKGARGEELLQRLAAELGRSDVEADKNGIIRLRVDGRAGKAWDSLRDALDRAGSDWREWVHLESRPPR